MESELSTEAVIEVGLFSWCHEAPLPARARGEGIVFWGDRYPG
jgi:hypothetical protein